MAIFSLHLAGISSILGAMNLTWHYIILFKIEGDPLVFKKRIYDIITDNLLLNYGKCFFLLKKGRSPGWSPRFAPKEQSTPTDTRDTTACCAASGPPNGSNKPNKSNKTLWPTILGRAGVNKDAMDLARAHMESGKSTNAQIINQILGTQITDDQLLRLLNGPRLRFHDLSNTKEIIRIIKQGSLISEKDLAGVYM